MVLKMKQLKIYPGIFQYDTCKEFCEAFNVGEGDVIITNEYIYKPFFAALSLKADVIFQEKYGQGEPSDEMAEAVYHDMNKDSKRVIAIGGGTIIDIAKFFALKNVDPILDLYDGVAEVRKVRELVLVPTTCGTGSEVTNLSILELKSRHTKLGLALEEFNADSAVLIPELLETLPYGVFATSSIDALIHAMESSLSPGANPYTKLFGYKAIEMILKGYLEIEKNGASARIPLLKDFLIASNYAGIAFGNAGCAAVHAMSYPLGAAYHVPHGEANYLLLVAVFRKYMELAPGGKITELNRHMATVLGCGETEVYDRLEKLLDTILARKPLRDFGVTEDDIAAFTEIVMTKQGRLMNNNYAPLDSEIVRGIYASIY